MHKTKKTISAIALGGAIFVAGCSDSSRPGPTLTAPLPAAAVANAAPTACNYNDIIKSAKAYTSNTDPIVALIKTMSQATDKVSTGLDVLAREAEARDAGITKLAADGGKTAFGVLVCTGLSPIPSQSELTAALGTDASGGVFEVRGGPTDPISAALAAASVPLWGAEPNSGQTWSSSLGQRALLYAYRIDFSTFTQESPALLNPGSVDEFGTAFEMNTVPLISPLPNALAVGVCVDNPSSYRLQSVTTIIALQGLNFCPAASSSVLGRGALQSIGRHVLAMFAPRPLYAATALIKGTGGLISGFSPKGAVDVTTSEIQLSFTAPVKNQKVNVPFSLTVRAVSVNGYPVDNVVVRLAISGNNGVGSDGVYQPILADVATANGGYAVFNNIVINKNGAYTLRAEGYFNGVNSLPTLFAYTNSFNVKP